MRKPETPAVRVWVAEGVTLQVMESQTLQHLLGEGALRAGTRVGAERDR